MAMDSPGIHCQVVPSPGMNYLGKNYQISDTQSRWVNVKLALTGFFCGISTTPSALPLPKRNFPLSKPRTAFYAAFSARLMYLQSDSKTFFISPGIEKSMWLKSLLWITRTVPLFFGVTVAV